MVNNPLSIVRAARAAATSGFGLIAALIAVAAITTMHGLGGQLAKAVLNIAANIGAS